MKILTNDQIECNHSVSLYHPHEKLRGGLSFDNAQRFFITFNKFCIDSNSKFTVLDFLYSCEYEHALNMITTDIIYENTI